MCDLCSAVAIERFVCHSQDISGNLYESQFLVVLRTTDPRSTGKNLTGV